MPSITIKNMPPALLEALRRRAQAHRRSMNSEVIVCLEATVQRHAPEVRQALLERIQHRRKTLQAPFVTEEALKEIREEGRS